MAGWVAPIDQADGEGGGDGMPTLAITLDNLPNRSFSTPLGEFRIIKTIGHGSYGRVKLVISSVTEEKMAVKIVRRNPMKENLAYTTVAERRKHRPSNNKPNHHNKQTHTKGGINQDNHVNDGDGNDNGNDEAGDHDDEHTKRLQTVAKRKATLKERILREANLCKLLRHPNIVSLHDFRVSKTHYYLFFDYIDGCQLAERIGPKGCSENQAAMFFAQIADALAYCHRYAIVHRDIKIENILVDRFDQIKLIDFGLANFYDPTGHLKTSCGTIPYTSPEILRGVKYIGPEVDIWSLGVVLFTMVTGTLPFGDPRYRENYFRILRSEVRYPHTMSADCRDLISFCLHPEPKERFNITQVQQHDMLAIAYQELGRPPPPMEHSGVGIALPSRLDPEVIREMAACLMASPDTILIQLNQELERGWQRPVEEGAHHASGEEEEEAEDDDNAEKNQLSKVLCRSCPLVSVYHLIATHASRMTMPHIDDVQSRIAAGIRIKEQLQRPKKLKWGRKKRFATNGKPRTKRQGFPIAKVCCGGGDDSLVCSHSTEGERGMMEKGEGSGGNQMEDNSGEEDDEASLSSKTPLQQPFTKSRPGASTNRKSLIDFGLTVNEINKSGTEFAASIAGRPSQSGWGGGVGGMVCRQLTLRESVQAKTRVIAGRGSLERFHQHMLATLDKLEMAYQKVRDKGRCAYVGQYSPSLSQDEPAVLDSLSCSFLLEIVVLSPYYPRFHLAKLPVLNCVDVTLPPSSTSRSTLFSLLISPVGGAVDKLPTMARFLSQGMLGAPGYLP